MQGIDLVVKCLYRSFITENVSCDRQAVFASRLGLEYSLDLVMVECTTGLNPSASSDIRCINDYHDIEFIGTAGFDQKWDRKYTIRSADGCCARGNFLPDHGVEQML